MINAMFATDDIGGMGYGGNLPWPHNKKDMNWFKAHTIGDVVVMGSNTWASGMPKPLRGRINCVVSRNQNKNFEGANVYNGDDPYDFCQDMELLYPNRTIWVIGGAMLLLNMRGKFDRIYHTKIYGLYDADTSIDPDVMTEGYKRILLEKHDDLEFSIYARD